MTTGDHRVRDFYDEVMYSDLAERFNEGSRFQNYGYWTPATVRYRDAADNLLGELMDLVPSEPDVVLDVACGQGATTAWLTDRLGAADVTGINISGKQLETCIQTAPSARFLLMDATALDFPDAHFDLVICVEAAFHFKTRTDFLGQAYRVLRPGGHLVLSDILFRPVRDASPYPGGEANRVEGLVDYAHRLERIGFDGVRVVDATEQCWRGFLRACRAFAVHAARSGEVGPAVARDLLRRLDRRELITSHYLLVGARRPATGR